MEADCANSDSSSAFAISECPPTPKNGGAMLDVSLGIEEVEEAFVTNGHCVAK
jgi:hypothetical protein